MPITNPRPGLFHLRNGKLSTALSLHSMEDGSRARSAKRGASGHRRRVPQHDDPDSSDFPEPPDSPKKST